MSLTYPPIVLTNGQFDVTTSGRTLTPQGIILADILRYPNATQAAFTLTGVVNGAQLDLAIVAMDGATYGLNTYPLGTTPTDLHGVWQIGTVFDYPTGGRCQVLLNSSLAFQSDQYVAIESDGLHVRPFGGSGYGFLVVEAPGGSGNLAFYADGTVTRWNTIANVEITSANGHIDLTANTDFTLGVGGNMQFTATAGGISTFSFGALGTSVVAQAGPIALETTTSGGVTGDITLTPHAAAYVRLNNRTRATSSLRVGSGSTALAVIDGNDGQIAADGALAGFYMRDRTDATKYALVYKDTKIHLLTFEAGGNVWNVDPTTGIYDLKTPWTAVPTLQNSWVNTGTVGVIYNNAEYSQDLMGRVRLRGSIKSGTATSGTLLFTMPTGFRPPASLSFPCASAAAYGEARVDSNGQVLIIAGSNANFSLSTIQYDTI